MRSTSWANAAWILGKISKIGAIRCQILRLKCNKFDYRWGSAPDPTAGAYSVRSSRHCSGAQTPPLLVAGRDRPCGGAPRYNPPLPGIYIYIDVNNARESSRGRSSREVGKQRTEKIEREQ